MNESPLSISFKSVEDQIISSYPISLLYIAPLADRSEFPYYHFVMALSHHNATHFYY